MDLEERRDFWCVCGSSLHSFRIKDWTLWTWKWSLLSDRKRLEVYAYLLSRYADLCGRPGEDTVVSKCEKN